MRQFESYKAYQMLSNYQVYPYDNFTGDLSLQSLLLANVILLASLKFVNEMSRSLKLNKTSFVPFALLPR